MKHSKPVRLGNRTYRVGLNAMESETAPTRGESVYLFLEFIIITSVLLVLGLYLTIG